MRESAIVRLLNGALYWYPPGSSDSPRPLADAAELARLQSLASARRAPLVFAVPGAELSLRELEFTRAEKRHISKSLPFLLEDEFAADIDELHFAARSLGPLRLGVATCSSAWMESWQHTLAALPALTRWIPEPLLLPWQTGELVIVVEANSLLVRCGVNQGFCVEPELAATLLAALAANSQFAAVIVYSNDQAAASALLPAALQERVQWRTGDFASALMLSEEDTQPLNLLQGKYGARLPLQQWWRQWRLVAGLATLAFGLQVASTWADYSRLEDENLGLRRQIEASYSEVNPGGKARDHLKALQQQLDGLRGGPGGSSFASLLERIGAVVHAQSGAQLASINFNAKQGDVRLNLVVPDFKAVESIRTQLAAVGLEAQMENSSAQGDAVRARLKVREQ